MRQSRWRSRARNPQSAASRKCKSTYFGDLPTFSLAAWTRLPLHSIDRGYNARVYSTGGWQLVARRIASDSARGQKDIVVLIGHSLGANATFDIASELNKQNIPVELIVTFDATSPQPVPKNVQHLVNFYQENGFGKRVLPGQGFQGELTNYDLTAETGLSHTTIEKSPRLHAVVIQKIANIVKKDLAERLRSSKPKKKKQKTSAQ
jgi:hypothetical protein